MTEEDKGSTILVNELLPGDLIFVYYPQKHIALVISVLHEQQTGAADIDVTVVSPLRGVFHWSTPYVGWDKVTLLSRESVGLSSTRSPGDHKI